MEGKSFYGKTTSPKVIAEASLAYSFSFDLQRFTGDGGWSLNSDDNSMLEYTVNGSAIASLKADTTTTWKLTTSGTSSTISIVASDNSAGQSLIGASIGGYNFIDAGSASFPLYINLKSNSNILSIAGGSGADSIIGGSKTKWISGGSGNDSLVAGANYTTLFGGEGDDYLDNNGKSNITFVYDRKGADTIASSTLSQAIRLTDGISGLPGVESVGTDNGNLLLNFGGSGSNSLVFAGGASGTIAFNRAGTSDILYYSKDKIDENHKSVSLTSAASLFSANGSPYSSNAVSINAAAANNTSLTIYGNSKGNYIIGSEHVATTIFSGAGNDFVSLNASKNDVFIYGGGNDTIVSLGSEDGTFVSLGAKNYKTLIQDGSALTSVSAGVFKLAFDNNNSLTFKDAAATGVSIRGFNTTDSLVYTPTAITSISGTNKSVTLGASFDSATFDGLGYKVVDGSAVSSAPSTFAISIGGANAAYAIGSNNQVTSILGSSGADTLQAGKAGASLVGNGGADLLIGNTNGADTFIYTGNGNATIQNYTYGKDLVSLGGAAVPTTDITKIKLESGKSNFIISLGSNAEDSVLTFESATKVDLVSVGSGNHDTLFHYEADKIIVDDNRITLGAAYKSNFNANANTWTNSNYKLSSIDASHVTVANGINITGFADARNSIIGAKFGGKIVGSEYADYLQSGVTGSDSVSTNSTTTIDAGAVGTATTPDTLVGGTGNDWFIYRGAQASIGSYTSNTDSIQIVGFNMVGDDVPTFASMPTDSKDLVLTFGTGSSLSIAGGATEQSVVTFRNGNHTFEYSAGTVSLDNKSVTLTAEYNPATHYIAQGTIATVNASAVNTEGGVVSLGANATLGTRLIGSTSQRNSLVSGAGNDYLTGGNAADVFEYTGGKDTVSNYTFSQVDSLVAADTLISDIKSGRVSGSKLIFTGTDKKNVLTFLSEDDAIEKVSLGGNLGYLTKDAYVKTGVGNDSLKFFSSARGTIELTNSLYSVAGAQLIASVDASAVTQGVTLVADSLAAKSVYILPNNKKRDRFEYAGGKVSISGYETGKDQLNLGIGTISGFTVTDGNVLITLDSNENNVVSIAGGSNKDFFIHQSNDPNSVYRKMALTQPGILTNKASKPTTVTVLGGAVSLDANALGGGTIKKIYAASGDVGNISITASDKNNTIINMGVAGSGVSIYGGKKNDKITGSTEYGDLFVYRTDGGVGGKDVITNFGKGDKISLGANPVASLNSAKINARNKSVMFQFTGNKNSLNLKSDDTITAVTVAGDNDTVYTFKKNAFSANGGTNVSLTSGFAGNFNINNTKVGDNTATNVNGSNVTRNLTFTGTANSETLVGGTKKTTFKAGGGQDSLVGGSGKDVFFYAKGNAGTTKIVDFDYTNDKIKIASGTLAKIESINGGVQLAMKDNSGNNIGWYQITGAASYEKNGNKKSETNAPGANTVFKANNTYYWFAPEQILSDDKTPATLAKAGDLVTSDTRVSASKVSGYDVIELNYSTNLVRAGIAVATSKATLPTKSS